MAEPLRHVPDETLSEAIDGRLPAGEREALLAHLSVCERCRTAHATLAWTKREVARLGEALPPPGLAADLLAALDREDREALSRGTTAGRARRWFASPVLLGALAAAAILVVAVGLWWGRSLPIPDAIARDYRGVESLALTPTLESNDPATLEDHLAARLGFRTPVYDLSSMDYRVVGARAHRFDGRPSAMSIYVGRRGDQLICEMFRGTRGELPTPDSRLTEGGVDFLMYRRGEVTVVLWQSGEVLCALAGAGDSNAILRMAVAKSGGSA